MRHVEVSVPPVEEQDSIDARVTPTGSLENLSQQEVDRLLDSSRGGLYDLFRRCALAVLNCGTQLDDARLIFESYRDFDIRIIRQPWGIKLDRGPIDFSVDKLTHMARQSSPLIP